MGKIYIILALCLLTSCSLLAPKTQKITVNTASGKPANCILKNDLGQWQTPSAQAVEVKNSAVDLKVNCYGKIYARTRM